MYIPLRVVESFLFVFYVISYIGKPKLRHHIHVSKLIGAKVMRMCMKTDKIWWPFRIYVKNG